MVNLSYSRWKKVVMKLADTAICQCKTNPQPVQVALKPAIQVTEKQMKELRHPTVTFNV